MGNFGTSARVLCLALVLMMSAPVDALNVLTHELINVAATGKDTLDNYSTTFDRYLRDSLGLAIGRETLLRTNGRMWTAEQWLAEGGEREDDGSPFSSRARFYRHFHNPLLPWSDAGLLTHFPFHLTPHQHTSAVRWMQAADQLSDDGGAAGGTWAWRDARRLHYLVLTTADARQREAYAADMFRALGQIMHLVVDASVPEHVRNDPHPFGTLSREVLRSRTAGNYEYWVSEQQAKLGDAAFTARYLSTPIGPGTGFHALPPPPGETIARLPVARLLDADRYVPEAPDPNVTLSGPIGLAEFANANFFSEDTLAAADSQGRLLPFPRREDLVRRIDLAPMSQRIRAYFEKPAGQGLVTKFALAECRLQGRAAALPPYPCVDEAVWEETASHMLPRAVGYARGVLDYFFRGSIRIARIAVEDPVPGSIVNRTGIWIDIENRSNERLEGVFEVYARHRSGTEQERRGLVATVNNGAPVSLDKGASGRFRLSLQHADATAYQILVYRGRLGTEEDAVIGQVFAVPHVQVVQRTYVADFSTACTRSRFSGSGTLLGERLSCQYRPINHRIEGHFVTNFVDRATTGAAGPAVASVRAFWKGASSGPAPLVIDGVEYANGVWQRRGTEPNPKVFSIVDPAARLSGTTLWVAVTVAEPTAEFTTQMATFNITSGSDAAEKRVDITDGDPVFFIYSQRTLRIRPLFDSKSHSVVSIGGFPAPTPPIRTDLLWKPEFPRIWRDVLEVTNTQGTHRIIDVFQTPPRIASTDYKAIWEAIPLEPPPFPRAPDLYWGAEVAPKPRTGPERDFWRAFVSNEDPPSSRIVLTGFEAAGP